MIQASDRAELLPVLVERWGAAFIIKHHTRFQLDGLPGLVATGDGAVRGLLTWTERGPEAELLTLDALTRRQGVGALLLDAFLDYARPAGLRRVLATVTNDQLAGMKLLQRRGFRFETVRPGAVDAARKIKPQIPETGDSGIALHDELDLFLDLSSANGVGTRGSR